MLDCYHPWDRDIQLNAEKKPLHTLEEWESGEDCDRLLPAEPTVKDLNIRIRKWL